MGSSRDSVQVVSGSSVQFVCSSSGRSALVTSWVLAPMVVDVHEIIIVEVIVAKQVEQIVDILIVITVGKGHFQRNCWK